jgi:electron transfer flavoprotein alpha subunit
MEKILVLVHLDETGTSLPKSAIEAVGAALTLGSAITVGIIGDNIQFAADSIASTGARILAVSGPEFSQPRYSTDAAAAEALCRAAEATIVIAPSTSRFARVLPGVAYRLNGAAETHITGLNTGQSKDLTVTRWFYRQRIEATLSRTTRPWFLLLEPGISSCGDGLPSPSDASAGRASVELIPVTTNPRTTVTGIRSPNQDQQTIRPDAKLLFVAGAGWTKKQSDGLTHVQDAEKLIKGFLTESGASLGSSKSLVDQSSENQTVLTFLTHLNQVGQTGATPRHPKGLSTCCHGEEPHVVGWRFINERRAINLDANCGWARGKADVVYVADAFKVMEKLNVLLEEKLAAAAR